MNILIIGGSRFVGYALVQAALQRGHKVTVFNRGKSNPGAFEHVEEIHGDRDGGLHVLNGRTWDAVIDTCGYVPRVVKASAEALQGAVRQYVFISTISVYAGLPPEGGDEDSPLAVLEDELTETIDGGSYGGLKVMCEKVVQDFYPDHALIIRPGLIVGPRDSTKRFDYWIKRALQGGDMLAPGTPEQAVQFVDVRDLAEWTIRMIEQQDNGIYNAVGPEKTLSMGELLATCAEVVGVPSTLVWVDEEFLLKENVQPWGNLPLWIPREGAGLLRASNQRALEKGFTSRTVVQTVTDTLAWLQEQAALEDFGEDVLSREREREILTAWQDRP